MKAECVVEALAKSAEALTAKRNGQENIGLTWYSNIKEVSGHYCL
jgi:hypothetical protein